MVKCVEAVNKGEPCSKVSKTVKARENAMNKYNDIGSNLFEQPKPV
jgi:hypothetical protein